MKNSLLFFLCAVFSLVVSAQDNPKYLVGAVPEVDGKIVFSKKIPVKGQISDEQLFSLMEKWAINNYDNAQTDEKDLNNRVLLSKADDKMIACFGEKYLEFKRSSLVLDRAKMIYQLILETKDGACEVTLRNIKYSYSDSKKLLPAEEMISDKIALNKKGDKLNRYYDKFRIHTVDSVNSIYKSIDIYLNGINTTGATTSLQAEAKTYSAPAVPQKESPVEVPLATAAQSIPDPVQVAASIPVTSNNTPQTIAAGAVATMEGFRQITPDKIPGNIIKLLGDWTLITSGTADQMNVMTASWGGLGTFWEKPVSFCFLNPSRYSVQTMDKGETYTISFYTEAYKDALRYCGSVSGRNTDKIKGSGLTPIKTPSGATAFAEAWMIFECKKIVVQPITPEAVVDKSLPNKDWSKSGYHKMYIGEILNVWIK
ncbi:DUF4468 domain-containing protein [Dysgonomonas sp. Marseille-Q5470]|uniref:DUF4468 domain-containing protein n=1 Tax=Dysgonomonas sp. Marseille-Q5470 TaxID=3039494 RepID=UPI0024BD20AD|nr:DUF4468 domain-containing protein [Dysgonomonas sp. Marseille-Q5470]MBS5978965.1 DUF4468 domain-containing protein [Dysgonomonas mossii]